MGAVGHRCQQRAHDAEQHDLQGQRPGGRVTNCGGNASNPAHNRTGHIPRTATARAGPVAAEPRNSRRDERNSRSTGRPGRPGRSSVAPAGARPRHPGSICPDAPPRCSDDDPVTGTLLEREHHQELLRAAADEAVAGRGAVVLVTGEAGIGKTTLLRTFVASLDERSRPALQPLRGM